MTAFLVHAQSGRRSFYENFGYEPEPPQQPQSTHWHWHWHCQQLLWCFGAVVSASGCCVFFLFLLLGWFTCQNNCGRSFVQFRDSMANMRDWLGSIGIRMETTLLRMGTSFVCTICVATIMTAQLTRTADRPGNRARRTVSYPSRRRVNEINQFVRRRQCMRAQALRSSRYARVTRVCVCIGRVRASAGRSCIDRRALETTKMKNDGK